MSQRRVPSARPFGLAGRPRPAARRTALACSLAAAIGMAPAALGDQTADPPPGTPPAAGPSSGPAVPPPPLPPPLAGPRELRARDGADGPEPPRRIIQGRQDVGPLSTAQQIDLRRDVDGGFAFGSVYRQGELFMRTLGALRAVFPRSEYMSPRAGLTIAGIPAGTRFQIGTPLADPGWELRAGMLDPSAVDARVGGLATDDAPLSPSAGAVRVDPWTGGRVIGTGLADDPVVLRSRLGLDGPANDRVGDEERSPIAARTATRSSEDSLRERPRTGAASPPRRVVMPAIVDDPDYRRQRLQAILDRAVAEASDRSPGRDGQAARGPSSSGS